MGFGLACAFPTARFSVASELMDDQSKVFTVYALIRPDLPNAIRYIGITSQPLKERLSGHCIETRHDNPYKFRWIMQLKRQGLKPKIVPLIVGLTQGEALEIEVELIREFRQTGHRLTNISLGGEAFTLGRKMSRRVRANMSAAMRRRFLSAEVREKQSAVLKKAWQSPELRARQSVKQKERWTPQQRSEAAIRMKKRLQDPEEKAKLSRESKARWNSSEYKARVVEAKTGWKQSTETKAKISAARKKYFQSSEARARQSADVKKHWVERKKTLHPNQLRLNL